MARRCTRHLASCEHPGRREARWGHGRVLMAPSRGSNTAVLRRGEPGISKQAPGCYQAWLFTRRGLLTREGADFLHRLLDGALHLSSGQSSDCVCARSSEQQACRALMDGREGSAQLGSPALSSPRHHLPGAALSRHLMAAPCLGNLLTHSCPGSLSTSGCSCVLLHSVGSVILPLPCRCAGSIQVIALRHPVCALCQFTSHFSLLAW